METVKFETALDIDEKIKRTGSLGFVEIPSKEYHATRAVSQSLLKWLAQSPSKLRWHLDHRKEEKDSPARRIGSAVHCAILEPEKFETSVVVMPDLDRRTKVGKAAYEEFQALADDKIILKNDEMDIVNRIYQKSRNDDLLNKLFKTGKKELSFFLKDPSTGLVLRSRPDNILEKKSGALYLVDLKTTDCAQEYVFSRDILKYGYHVQAAFYMDIYEQVTGRRPDGFVIVAVEKSRDCDYTTWTIPEDVLREATKEYRGWLEQFKRCLVTNEWPGYSKSVIEFTLPKWKQQQLENEFW